MVLFANVGTIVTGTGIALFVMSNARMVIGLTLSGFRSPEVVTDAVLSFVEHLGAPVFVTLTRTRTESARACESIWRVNAAEAEPASP